MTIYQDSLYQTLQNVLAATYPVCQKLVGSAFFRQLAKGYIRQTIHAKPDITGYGENFAQFIHESVPMHQLCYLADVAALEWACHHALAGPYIPLLDTQALANVPQDKQGDLTFSLYQNSTLLASPYPILRIWESHQGDIIDENISLEEGGSRLLVHLRGKALCLVPLRIEAFKMLTYFSAGMSFDVVCQKCFEEYPLLDIPQLFADCVAKQYLVSFALAIRS